MVSSDAYLLMTLLQLPGVGRKTLIRLYTPGVSSTLHDAEGILSYLNGLRSKTKRIREYSLADVETALAASEKVLEHCAQLDVHIISYTDKDYPARLKTIDDLPAVLYYKGNIRALNAYPTLAIIGTREPSDFGARIAERVGVLAAQNGITTVSGLAVGCDTGGHTGTVAADGATVAILANGLDTIYPASNTELAERILSHNGCLISEYPPYSEVQKGYFVDRDRLQAGLSDAVFVVETGEKGGTLHTVEYAEKYGRKVYCFNHPESMRQYEKALGNQMLIRKSRAVPVADAEGIIQMFQAVASMIQSTHNSISGDEVARKTDNQSKPAQLSMWGDMDDG